MTEPFVLDGRTSNVVAEISTTISQTLGVLHADARRTKRVTAAGPSAREISYYFGRDSDGAWTEGASWDRVWLPSVPPGRYVLIVEPEGPRR